MVGLHSAFLTLFHQILLSDEYYFEDTDPEGEQGFMIDDICDRLADDFTKALHHFYNTHKDEIEKGAGIDFEYIKNGVIEKVQDAFKKALEEQTNEIKRRE